MVFYKESTPKKIYDIIECYFKQFSKDGKYANVPKADQENMVAELKTSYKMLPYEERKDILIPESADFLIDECIVKVLNKYAIRYNWPENSLNEKYELSKGDVIDRIGDAYGTYACPLKGREFSIKERSLPYYFTEQELLDITKCPSYHKYILNSDVDMSEFKIGTTKEAFDQEGGAKEIKFGTSISNYININKVEEIEYATR